MSSDDQWVFPSSNRESRLNAPTIPDHDLIRVIGKGSYGEVWLARNALGTLRAAKVIYRSRFQDSRPFEREFSGIKKFEPLSRGHEGLVDILQVGRDEEQGYFYYVMELADDAAQAPRAEETDFDATRRVSVPDLDRYTPHTLASDFAQRGRLPVSECVQRGIALSLALEYLHSRGLVHRDIKPANVVFVHGHPKLADIGTVTEAGEAASLVGTPGFMPPEGPGTRPADIYSLGKVLYEISTGKDRDQWPKPLTSLDQMSDRKEWLELNEVITRACESEVKKRYQSAADFRADLALVMAGRSVRQARARERGLRVLAIVAGVLAIMALGWAVAQQMLASRVQRVLREELLREAQLIRAGVRSEGWLQRHTALLERAASNRMDASVDDQALASLTGLEVRRFAVFNQEATSVAFAPSGQVIFGGTTNLPPRLWDGKSLHPLPGNPSGLVGFDARGAPIQFARVGAGRFRLLDLRLGTTRREFVMPDAASVDPGSEPVLALNPKGEKVAAAVTKRDGGSSFFVWDGLTGRILGHQPIKPSVAAFSPDGRFIGTGDASGHAKVWATAGLTLTADLPAGRGTIQALAFSPDYLRTDEPFKEPELLLAVGDNSAGLSVWSVRDQRLRRHFLGSAYEVATVAFSPDGVTLASAGREEVRIWDLATGRFLLVAGGSRAPHHFDSATGLAFSGDGRRLAVSTKRGPYPHALAVLDIDEGRAIRTLRGLSARATKIFWSDDGSHLAAVSHQWELGVWRMPAGRLEQVFQVNVGESADNAAVAFDATCSRIAFAAGHEARLYEMSSRAPPLRWPLDRGFSDSLQFDALGRLLLLRSDHDPGRGIRRQWSLRELQPLNRMKEIARQRDNSWITWLTAFASTNDYFLVSGGVPAVQGQSFVVLYDKASGQERHRFPARVDCKNLALAVDPTGRFLAFQGNRDSPTSQLLGLPDGNPIRHWNHACGGISPGSLLHVEPLTSGIQVHGLAEDGIPIKLGLDFVCSNDIRFSPDGRFVAWPSDDGGVFVADLAAVKAYLRKFHAAASTAGNAR